MAENGEKCKKPYAPNAFRKSQPAEFPLQKSDGDPMLSFPGAPSEIQPAKSSTGFP